MSNGLLHKFFQDDTEPFILYVYIFFFFSEVTKQTHRGMEIA